MSSKNSGTGSAGNSSSKSSSSSSSSSSSGTNSGGNRWNTPGGTNSSSGSSYHYSNRDGSYYYSNDNGSKYYNTPSGQGYYKWSVTTTGSRSSFISSRRTTTTTTIAAPLSVVNRRARPPVTPVITAGLQHTVKEVSAEQLELALQENARPMLVDAFAQWCGPCRFLVPQLDIVAQRFGDRLDVLKFDTEMYPRLATALQVRGLPTLFFVKDGKLRYRMEGALTADQLEEVIEFVLFDGPPPSFAAPQQPNSDPQNPS